MVTWLLETFFWVTTMSSKFVTSVFQKISIQVPIIRSLLILHCLLNGWHWRLWITGCTLIVEFVISLLQVSCNSISFKLIKLTWHLPWYFVECSLSNRMYGLTVSYSGNCFHSPEIRIRAWNLMKSSSGSSKLATGWASRSMLPTICKINSQWLI